MKQLTLNGKTLGVVDVPDGASGFEYYNNDFGSYIDFGFWSNNIHTGYYSIDVDPGQWSILGRLNDITEEQAAGLVKIIDGNRYENYNGDYPIWWHKATESLQSFFHSNGIEGNPLIILNEKV